MTEVETLLWAGGVPHQAPEAAVRLSQPAEAELALSVQVTQPLTPCRALPRLFPETALISPLLPSQLFAFACFQGLFPSAYHLPAACFLSCCLTHASSTALWVHPLPRAFLSCIAAALSHQAQFHPWVSDSTPDIHQTPILWGHVLQKASTVSRDLKSLPQSRGRWELIIELQHWLLASATNQSTEGERDWSSPRVLQMFSMAPQYLDTWSYLLSAC